MFSGVFSARLCSLHTYTENSSTSEIYKRHTESRHNIVLHDLISRHAPGIVIEFGGGTLFIHQPTLNEAEKRQESKFDPDCDVNV